MSPRQVAAYLQFADADKRHESSVALSLQAIAAQGDGKMIKDASEKLLRD
jgi:hypothetical protein